MFKCNKSRATDMSLQKAGYDKTEGVAEAATASLDSSRLVTRAEKQEGEGGAKAAGMFVAVGAKSSAGFPTIHWAALCLQVASGCL